MASSKAPASEGVVIAPERVEHSLRAPEERGRLEREFDVLGDLGQGGMGQVLRARDLRLCRDVAVKVLAPTLRFDLSARRRFVIEAQVAAQLEHPNIVPFYAIAGDGSGKPGFVMRLVGGESFREYLDAAARSREAGLGAVYDLSSRLERFLKACDAIEYAHARGVVHRDLKPENVMLGSHNEVYVVDWGLAKVLAQDDTEEEAVALTAAGTTVGTAMYMAPEQARGARDAIGAASDQYTLGLILQELATLQPPRRAERGDMMKAAARGRRAPFEHRFAEPLPASLEAIIAKATAYAPAARYPSVTEFARDVRCFMRGDEVLVYPDSRAARVWRYLRRRPEVVFGVVLALTLIASGAITFALSGELHARALAEEQTRRIASLAAQVGRTAAEVDARAGRVDVVLEGLVTAAAMELAQPPSLPDDHAFPADLAKDSAETSYDARYHQRVSFARAVTVLPTTARDTDPLIARAGDFERIFLREAVRATGSEDALGLPRAEQVAAAKAKSSILWFDLAFESGIMFGYPGGIFFPSDFDPRKRPWYMQAAGRRGHQWGSPHPDATSGALVIPCSAAIYDDENRFVGVATVDLALDDLLARIALDSVEGFRDAAVLDERGDVVFSTADRGRNMGAGVHENRAIERRPFGVDNVRGRVANGATDGLVRAGDGLVLFQRLGTLGWSLAVTFASAPYDRR
jgi:serine/threonine-protein kinase